MKDGREIEEGASKEKIMEKIMRKEKKRGKFEDWGKIYEK